MGGVDCCGRVVLVLINMFFQFMGFFIFALGMVLIFGLTLLQSYLPIDINSFLDTLPDLTSSLGFTDVVNATETTSGSSDVIDLPGLLRSIAIAFVVMGLFMLIAGSCGCCGGCCAVKVMLIIYIVITALVCASEFILIALLYTGVIRDQIRDKLNSTLINDYAGIADFSMWGLTWNVMMSFMKCCGIDDYTDFQYSQNWDGARNFTFSGYTAGYVMITPVACCKFDGSFPSVTPIDTNCTLYPNDNSSNWNTGCWGEISSMAMNQETIFIGVISGILAFEAICIGIAVCVLIMTWNKNKVEPQDTDNSNDISIVMKQSNNNAVGYASPGEKADYGYSNVEF